MNCFTLGTCCLVLTITLLSSMVSTTAALTCGKICVHTLEFAPVCGSDGKTYSNEGALECARRCKPDLKVVHVDSCKQKNQVSCRSCICIAQYEPVCGSDGKTYGNSCELRCKSLCNPDLRMLYKGECGEQKATQ